MSDETLPTASSCCRVWLFRDASTILDDMQALIELDVDGVITQGPGAVLGGA